LLNPKGKVIGLLLTPESPITLGQVRYLWYPLAVGAPLVLALSAALGYYYTVHYLSWRLLETIWVILAAALLNLIVNRWLQLRIQQRMLKEAKQQAIVVQAESLDGDGMAVPLDDLEMEDAEIGEQATKLVRVFVLGTLLVGLWLIWAEVLPALAIFEKVTLWNNTVEIAQTVTQPDGTSAISKYVDVVPITLADLGLAIIILVLTIFASRNIPGLMEITILQRLPMTSGGSYAITAITTYIITGVGLVLSFGAIGIGWAKVQWLVAAMTVGIGFGMKEIITNFISGLIILFERPIRVGDVVTVGNVSGVVSRIRIRATVITDFDRKELIVPNQRFITDEVLNWTLSDSIIRVVFPVSVSNRSDVAQIRQLLIDLAMEHPMVLPVPAPSVVFNGFGPGALLFNLRVFIRREDYAKVLDSVNTAIQLKLKEEGVEMATDRQEIQVRPAVEEQKRFVSPFEAKGKNPPDETA
ncbi:MAG: mechanosensitive ion channel, partial [Gammaproteobacteria bacterium]|nr:mechanosensitive ion channel [Gammaproteobacteria bacterium]